MQLIAEKIGAADWASHLGKSDSVFVNASTFGLMLTGKVVDVDAEARTDMAGYFRRLTARLGEPVIRAAVGRAIRIMGEQFVLGATIEQALQAGRAAKAMSAPSTCWARARAPRRTPSATRIATRRPSRPSAAARTDAGRSTGTACR